MTSQALLKTEVKEFPVSHGKVREIYDLGQNLLIVASDRISAFDVVMPNGIPDKGKILTQMSLFWFDFFAGKVKHHLISRLKPELQHHAARLLKHGAVVIICQVFSYSGKAVPRDARRVIGQFLQHSRAQSIIQQVNK